MYKRIFTIVIDSVGCGEAPDAADYGDVGANTIKHISEADNGIFLPHMEELGYGHLTEIQGVKPIQNVIGNYSKMKEVSLGKDTLTGHWEIMGLKVEVPFQTFTETGFPQDLIDELEKRTGRKIVGNKASSGTVILDELGEHQMKTGDLIVYTSSDSVLQIAAHEEIIPLEELYKICEIARELTLEEKWKVGRIIARPYLGSKKGDFKRTSNRHDYALKPIGDTALVYLKEVGYDVLAFGKISDIYDNEGITRSTKQVSNEDGMNHFTEALDEDFVGLAYLNLVDFDALYGHRRDPLGYKKALEEFDVQLGVFMDKMRDGDLLMITADHGNDPIAPGSDHTREYVPLLVYAKDLKGGALPLRESFADIGATISDNFKTSPTKYGRSFLAELK